MMNKSNSSYHRHLAKIGHPNVYGCARLLLGNFQHHNGEASGSNYTLMWFVNFSIRYARLWLSGSRKYVAFNFEKFRSERKPVLFNSFWMKRSFRFSMKQFRVHSTDRQIWISMANKKKYFEIRAQKRDIKIYWYRSLYTIYDDIQFTETEKWKIYENRTSDKNRSLSYGRSTSVGWLQKYNLAICKYFASPQNDPLNDVRIFRMILLRFVVFCTDTIELTTKNARKLSFVNRNFRRKKNHVRHLKHFICDHMGIVNR